VKKGAQFIIATHSSILMAYPDAQTLQLGGHTIRPLAYSDTEHFTVTRDFLNNYQRMLRALVDEERNKAAFAWRSVVGGSGPAFLKRAREGGTVETGCPGRDRHLPHVAFRPTDDDSRSQP